MIPKINRETVDFASDTEVCNIGYKEGLLNDNRPYRLEMWSSYGITSVTIFISNVGIEKKTEKEIKDILVKNNLIKIIDDRIFITLIKDNDGNTFYDINVPLESNYAKINECLVTLDNYE